jgi:transcriptional regulator NrdR family protein
MPSQTLRECPFCKSGDVELVTSLTERAGKWRWWDAHISCHSCRSRTGTFEDETKVEAVALAVAAWNRRAGEETK